MTPFHSAALVRVDFTASRRATSTLNRFRTADRQHRVVKFIRVHIDRASCGAPPLLRFMSYLPLLSFGPSAVGKAPAYYAVCLTSALRSGHLTVASALCGDTRTRSPGVSSVALRCTIAEYTLCILDGYGLRDKWPARPMLAPHIRFLSIDPHVCSTLPRDPPRGVSILALSLTLHLHQVG